MAAENHEGQGKSLVFTQVATETLLKVLCMALIWRKYWRPPRLAVQKLEGAWAVVVIKGGGGSKGFEEY